MSKDLCHISTLSIDMTAANMLPKLGPELLCLFSRFEFALKEFGFGRTGKGDAVEANWDDFANRMLTPSYFDRVRKNNLTPTILDNPPSRQVLNNGKLDWEICKSPPDVQSFIGAVRRVRNNLVHGGKSGDPDIDRNDRLVAEAIAVLIDVLGLHCDLRMIFEGKY